MKDSKIEWTDFTFNPWEGCTKVSPGCANCYAEARNKRFNAGANWGKSAPRRMTGEANWMLPLRWNAKFPGTRVFCASLADWLDDEVPISWTANLFNIIVQTPKLKWQLLTKRPENWSTRMAAVLDYYGATKFFYDKQSRGYLAHNAAFEWLACNAPYNVWIGTTVEDQERADQRIPELLEIPAVVRFLSCEPLLGPVDLALGDPKHRTAGSYHAEIHWVIAGGESGTSARPMHPDWARSLRDQCQQAGVAYFFKQWGSNPAKDAFTTDPVNAVMQDPKGGRLLDGSLHNAFPHHA